MFRALGTLNITRSPNSHVVLSDLLSLIRSCAVLPSRPTILLRVSHVITGCPGRIRTPMRECNADAMVRRIKSSKMFSAEMQVRASEHQRTSSVVFRPILRLRFGLRFRPRPWPNPGPDYSGTSGTREMPFLGA